MQSQEKEIITDEMIDLVLKGVDLDSAVKELNQVIPDLLELKESLTGVVKDPYIPTFDLRSETKKDWEVWRQVGRFVNRTLSKMSPQESAMLASRGKLHFAAVGKLAAILAERIPGEMEREAIKEKCLLT